MKLRYFTNGKQDIRIPVGSQPPEGYYEGRMNPFYSKGYFWITNDVDEKTIKDEAIPEGWHKGRLDKSKETIDKQRNTLKSKRYHHYTDGDVELHIPEGEQIPEGFDLGRPAMSEAQKLKLSKSHTGLKHSEKTKQLISKNSNNNRGKSKQTCLEKYGVDCVLKLPHVIKKINDTKRQNGTFNTSKPEQELFENLKSIYSDVNVLRHYKDKERYPFYCDFYIPSEDLFIELNAHWTHGSKPYDPEDDFCKKQLKEWTEKAKTSKFYAEAIQTWTVRDVKKLKTAKENKLNYRVIY